MVYLKFGYFCQLCFKARPEINLEQQCCQVFHTWLPGLSFLKQFGHIFSILGKLTKINANFVLQICFFWSIVFQDKTRDTFKVAGLPVGE